MDENAQTIIMESIITATILIISLFFVYALTTPPLSTYSPNQLSVLGDETLRNLDLLYTNYDIFHNSRLVEYVILNDTKNLTDFLSLNLPDTVAYNLYLYNDSAGLGNSILLYRSLVNKPGEETSITKCHRVIVYRGFVYDVVLEMWYL